MPFPPPSSGGINQLTGDVTAGPGTGSQAATLASVVTAGTAGDSTHYPIVTFDAKGRITSTSTQAASSGITQLTGDVTAGPGSGSQAASLAATTAVSNTVGGLGSVAAGVTRRSATATASLGETTEFTGSTASQTITLPAISSPNKGVYRIINNASVAVDIKGGTNSIEILGTTYGASTAFSVAPSYAYDFIYDTTGIWVCMAITRPALTPATTVTGPDTYGSPSVVGTSLLYAREDHDHGLPAAPTSPGNSASEVELTTTGSTSIVSYTPTAQGNYLVSVYFRVVTATTTVTVTVTYTDSTGSQTITVLNAQSEATGSYSLATLPINATAAAITVSATAGTANQVYVSAAIGEA